jgi:hypothetical protein
LRASILSGLFVPPGRECHYFLLDSTAQVDLQFDFILSHLHAASEIDGFLPSISRRCGIFTAEKPDYGFLTKGFLIAIQA